MEAVICDICALEGKFAKGIQKITFDIKDFQTKFSANQTFTVCSEHRSQILQVIPLDRITKLYEEE